MSNIGYKRRFTVDEVPCYKCKKMKRGEIKTISIPDVGTNIYCSSCLPDRYVPKFMDWLAKQIENNKPTPKKPKTYSLTDMLALRENGLTVKEIAETLGCTHQCVSHKIRQHHKGL